jgi:hypothetical protein
MGWSFTRHQGGGEDDEGSTPHMHAWSKSMEYQSIEYIYINKNNHKNIIYP